MTDLVFRQLNRGWNAEPNAPFPEVDENGPEISLRFLLNHFIFRANPNEVGRLTFKDCSLWRLGPTNDEGWYRGQCRYTAKAPKWGEFYELLGPDRQAYTPDDWHEANGTGSRHFLFYLRDETFECFSSDWRFERSTKFRRPMPDEL